MKVAFSLFFFFSIFLLKAQSTSEQTLYNEKIDLVVDKGNGNFDFLDANGQVVGRKKIQSDKIQYFDKQFRLLKSINTKEAVTSESEQTKPNEALEDSDQQKIKLLLQQENTIRFGSLIVQRVKNKVFYYNLKAELLRTSKKKRFSQRIIYSDLQGERIGWKKKERNGYIVYRDKSNRITGQSYRNANGVFVYESYKNRITPQFMISDPFYLE